MRVFIGVDQSKCCGKWTLSLKVISHFLFVSISVEFTYTTHTRSRRGKEADWSRRCVASQFSITLKQPDNLLLFMDLFQLLY